MSVTIKDKAAELKRIKKNIENSYEYFRDNYDRFNEFRKFVFVTTMTDNDASLNKTLNRPSIEFNVLEAYISRLRGEFSKHIPSIMVSGIDGTETDPRMIRLVEDHIRYILFESNKKGLEYNCYTDTLSGGFSAAKVYTDYINEMSFDQDIYVRRAFDPTMIGFDPLASEDDKSDAEYCFELYPVRKEEFLREHPKAKTEGMKFTRNIGNFNWSYQNQGDDVLVRGDYYEKKRIKKKIVRVNGHGVMTEEEYVKFVEEWEGSGRIEQVPVIVGKPRTTYLTKIIRYQIIETEILSAEETDYDSLPLVFIDGNSILNKDQDNSSVKQYTRPAIYQARGAQKLKNYAGCSLANELENLSQGQFIVPKDGIPLDYALAYKNPQQANILVYNQYKDDDPSIPLNPPQVMMRRPIPREITETFTGADGVIQNVLGAFDASLAKLSERDVSGIAIQETITLSNASAMPYVVGFLKGLQAIANRILELIPKIYITPRTIPTLTKDGKKEYVLINDNKNPQSIRIDYKRNALQVKVEAGPSFSVQQEKALQQIIAMSQASPLFGQFINTMGLNVLLDNMSIRGIEQLRQMADQYMKQVQEAQRKAAENQTDPNVLFAQVESQKNQQDAKIAKAKLLLEARENNKEYQLEIERLKIERHKLQVESAKIMADIEEARIKAAAELRKAKLTEESTAAELTLKAVEQNIKLAAEQAKLNKELSNPDIMGE